MLELAPYGLSGLVAILLVAFFFECECGSASFSDKYSFRSINGANSRPSKSVEGCTWAADMTPSPRGQKHEGL
jgi:hypothetical protein